MIGYGVGIHNNVFALLIYPCPDFKYLFLLRWFIHRQHCY